MSNTDLEQIFEGLDEAEASDRYPKLPPNGDFLLELTRMVVIDGFQSGQTLVVEHKVLASSIPDVVIGGVYSSTITKLNDRQNRDLKMGKVKNLIASLTNVDPSSKQKWMQTMLYLCKKQVGTGWRFRVQTGPRSTAKTSGKEYTPVMFLPAPVDQLAPNQPKRAA